MSNLRTALRTTTLLGAFFVVPAVVYVAWLASANGRSAMAWLAGDASAHIGLGDAVLLLGPMFYLAVVLARQMSRQQRAGFEVDATVSGASGIAALPRRKTSARRARLVPGTHQGAAERAR